MVVENPRQSMIAGASIDELRVRSIGPDGAVGNRHLDIEATTPADRGWRHEG